MSSLVALVFQIMIVAMIAMGWGFWPALLAFVFFVWVWTE